MNQVFWVGVYPGLTDEAVQFMTESFHEAIAAAPGSNGHARVVSQSNLGSSRAKETEQAAS
jgi:hypothetical protein